MVIASDRGHCGGSGTELNGENVRRTCHGDGGHLGRPIPSSAEPSRAVTCCRCLACRSSVSGTIAQCASRSRSASDTELPNSLSGDTQLKAKSKERRPLAAPQQATV